MLAAYLGSVVGLHLRERRLLTFTVSGIDVTKFTSELVYGDGTEVVGMDIPQAILNGFGADEPLQVTPAE